VDNVIAHDVEQHRLARRHLGGVARRFALFVQKDKAPLKGVDPDRPVEAVSRSICRDLSRKLGLRRQALLVGFVGACAAHIRKDREGRQQDHEENFRAVGQVPAPRQEKRQEKRHDAGYAKGDRD
jgi:hypothetical protein